MFADYHLHTCFSDDSPAPMEDMVRRAIALGLDEICFTEHVDYGIKTEGNCDYDACLAELNRMRTLYGDRITLRFGIEFGVQTHTADQYREDAARYPFEFIIMSCHQVQDREFCTGDFQRGRTQEAYQTAYYQEILDCTREYRDYSVLGHLDMIKRYDPCGAYPDEKILPLAEAIFRQVIRDGKGIEVNTSCFRYGLADLTPSRRLLTLYRDLGGEILTLGSDAHEPRHLADRIPEVRESLKEMGFRTFCTYEKREPVFHPL